MQSAAQRMLLPVLLMTSTLVLGACGEKTVSMADAQAQGKAAEAARNDPNVANADFWKPISTHLAATYSGECAKKTGAKRSPGKIVIGADGNVTANGHSNSLLKSKELTLTHTRTSDTYPLFELNAKQGDAVFALTSGPKGLGSAADATNGDSAFNCEKSKDNIALAGKNLYEVYGAMLASAPRKLNCLKSPDMQTAVLNYQLSKGVLTLQDQKFDLSKADEAVVISEGFSALAYTATDEAGRSVKVLLDKKGKLQMLDVKDLNFRSIGCN